MDDPLTPVTLRPVGVVRGGRGQPTDDGWDDEVCTIELDDARFGPEALAGLAGFSHVEVVYLFHLVDPEGVEVGARRPRERADWPLVGIFAQRGRNRPNRLGVTVCRIVEVDGTGVGVRGLDAVHGTPVLDIKPWMAGFGPRGEVLEPTWAGEIMADYW